MSTSTPTIIPCLWLDDQAEAAARFYVETFPGGRVVATSRYPETRDNPGGKPRGSVMTVEVEVAGFRLTLLDGGPQFTINPSISFFVHAADPPEADQLFARLEDGGQVLMPIGSYPWSERFGWVKDRYGVSWQVIVGPRGPAGATIAPCLMFSGAQAGNATAAMEAYAATFPDSRVDTVAHYGPGEGPETYVKHARFVLAGHDLVAMDSHVEHGFGFDEGVSLQVMCADQAEIDRYWAALTDGGAPGPCGWLKDRFGVSWQVVPTRLAAWMTSGDPAARDRAFTAMLGMQKLDLAALEAAFAGG